MPKVSEMRRATGEVLPEPVQKKTLWDLSKEIAYVTDQLRQVNIGLATFFEPGAGYTEELRRSRHNRLLILLLVGAVLVIQLILAAELMNIHLNSHQLISRAVAVEMRP